MGVNICLLILKWCENFGLVTSVTLGVRGWRLKLSSSDNDGEVEADYVDDEREKRISQCSRMLSTSKCFMSTTTENQMASSLLFHDVNLF